MATRAGSRGGSAGCCAFLMEEDFEPGMDGGGGGVGGGTCNLQNGTFTFVFHRYDGAEDGSDRFVEHGFQALLGECRTFQILDGANLLGHGQTLRVGDRR